MRKLLMSAFVAASLLTVSGLSCAEVAAPAKATVLTKPDVKTKARAFGLTESLAVLFACPESRFESANMIALGGVLQENKARIDASPLEGRMDLMTKLVASETDKANAFISTHKVDCAKDAEPAAAYWNKTLHAIAASEKGAVSSGHVAVPTAPTRPPRDITPTTPVTGLRLP